MQINSLTYLLTLLVSYKDYLISMFSADDSEDCIFVLILCIIRKLYSF